MRKSLLVLLLLICSQLNVSFAQNLFSAPDTVCVRQPVYLIDSFATPAESYYWGFCSGYIYNTVQGTNAGSTFFNRPTAIEVVKDGADYYAFIAVQATTGSTSDTLLLLDFGSSLNNEPDTVNFGTLNDVMPLETSKLFAVKALDGNWHLFICGGSTVANSSIVCLHFGSTLANTPNIVNMGNHSGLLNGPRGIFVQEEGGDYYGYVVNNGDNKLLRLLLGDNSSQTPTVVDLGSSFGLGGPTDMVPVFEKGNWHAFVTNATSNTLSRFDFGTSITNTPTPFNLGNTDGRLFDPSSITFVRDCNTMHLFLTNTNTSDLVRLDLPTITGPYTGANYIGLANMSDPTSISRVIRDKDSIFTFVTNGGNNSLSQIYFPQCQDVNIQSSTEKSPPIYSYKAPGTYTVYLAVNEGRADMQVECKQIEALVLPPMTIGLDTFLCQGDTATLLALSPPALTYTWTPYYRIDTFDINRVKVAPEFTVAYNLVMTYANGCIVDTSIDVTVSKNKADAGPDRTIGDGATTVIGGPMTTSGPNYTLVWSPNQFIKTLTGNNPEVNPPFDYTYYLEVTNTDGCYDIDTVVVHVDCNDINVPNAFIPGSSDPTVKTIGLLNNQIVKLNSFSIYDRWGRQVFQTTDVTKRWDGKVNGKPAPLGVYVWEADGFCTAGKRFKRSGNITLIR